MLAIVILLTRPLSGALADRIGYRALHPVPRAHRDRAGPAGVAARRSRGSSRSAIFFGLGFGTAYPVCCRANVMRDILPTRRGARVGAAILAGVSTPASATRNRDGRGC